MNGIIKVLVVDDEANIRASLKEMLTRDGHQVVTVDSGEAALALISGTTQAFDVVLIDLKMKGIGGIKVLKALRQQSPDTVAIVLTAHASLGTAVEAVRHGAHDYLFKPCKPTELRESIRRGSQNRPCGQPPYVCNICFPIPHTVINNHAGTRHLKRIHDNICSCINSDT